MDVDLYVYDLSKGMARQLSASLLGTHIDAIYHTAIVMEGIEYLYDSGIQTVRPGMTHLGPPEQVIRLGKTELPLPVILDYVESMKDIYTVQAYDLWTHNCNNFSNDFATFLTGKGIPGHITNLPTTVLNSPFGLMMKPMIDDMVKNTRAQKQGGLVGIQTPLKVKSSVNAKVPLSTTIVEKGGAVWKPTELGAFEELLQSAKDNCAVVFFTSANCGPCKALYPSFDDLADETGYKAVFIRVDILKAPAIARKYEITATPTFVTFLRGDTENRWVGADPSKLRGNVGMLIQMAWPPHSHQSLRLPTLRGNSMKPILYSKVPPLEKLMAKIGPSAEDQSVQGVRHFIESSAKEGAAEVTLPDLKCFSKFLRDATSRLPPETLFAVVDLLRAAMADARLSGYFAADEDTIAPLFDHVNRLPNCPYPLRLVTLQTACNLFSSPLYPPHILTETRFSVPLIGLITTSLLDDDHHPVRVAAASLAFNMAVSNSKFRIEERREALPEEEQVELAASLLEAISVEEKSPEGLKGYLLALGHLVYCLPKGSELADLLKAMDADGTVLGKSKLFPKEKLIQEIGSELLGQGIAKNKD